MTANPILNFEVDKSTLRYIGHDLQRHSAVAAEARDRVEHVVVLEDQAAEAAVLAADARLQLLDPGELEERSPQLDAPVLARAEETRPRGEEQPDAAIVEDVAAARGQRHAWTDAAFLGGG